MWSGDMWIRNMGLLFDKLMGWRENVAWWYIWAFPVSSSISQEGALEGNSGGQMDRKKDTSRGQNTVVFFLLS